MNKIFTLIAVALVGYTPIKAQNVKLGVRAGANISTLFNTRQKIIRYLTKELKFFILEFLIYHNYDSKKEYQLRKQKYK
ncbi:MAG: hypothetical protein ACFNP4_11250, partial [Capnocytophaga gingivalis]|uniref:hypothetical protein n=1 Tax=Capnocytophaga gingivalis TaxID=1017 RepID=UPI00360727A1